MYSFWIFKGIKKRGNTINYCMFVVICALCIRFELGFWRTPEQYYKLYLLYDVCCNLRAMWFVFNRVLKELGNTINYCIMFVVICALCICFDYQCLSFWNERVREIGTNCDALMKMISCFSVHHRWWVSQILASNLQIVKHFYHALHIVILDKYELYIQKQEIISIDGIHIKLPMPS
jgi:hypothetical protein